MSRWRVLARDVLHEAGAVPVQIEGAVLQASQGRFAENLAAPDFDKFETTVASGGAIPLAKDDATVAAPLFAYSDELLVPIRH